MAISALRGDRAKLRFVQRVLIFAGACLYAFIPFTGVLSHQNVGWYLAIMSFCSAVIVGITYFSNDKWQFSACVAPSFFVASAAPFVFGVTPANAVVVSVLQAMFTLLALVSAAHRSELVEGAAKQQAARSRAEVANIEKSQFIANVSHELRTPLNAIIGYGEMLRESATDHNRLEDKADAEKLLASSGRLMSLVNNLVDISKIEAGKLSLNIGWYGASDMLAAAVEAARPLADANGNSIVLNTSELGQGVGDEFRLTQCVVNLLCNAAKFTTDGIITLDARREPRNSVECFVVEVTDNGIGIAPEVLEQLFNPFTQADASIARQFEGAGLGLAITQRVARLLGGDVAVASTVGKGSTFTLWAPVIARISTEHRVDDSEPAQFAA